MLDRTGLLRSPRWGIPLPRPPATATSVARARAKKVIDLRQPRSSSLTGTLLQRENVRLQAEHFSLHSFEDAR